MKGVDRYIKKELNLKGRLPKLSGSVCTHHPVAPCLNPNNFFQFVILLLWYDKDANKQKEDGIGPH